MAAADADPAPVHIRPGTAAFWRANLALFLGGFVTFAALYGTQPLLPAFSAEFGISPTVASLSLSAATGTLAVSLLVAATVSESLGRKEVMGASLVGSAVLTLLSAWSPDFTALLVCRAIQGATLAGLPAVAMAYLGEEVHHRSLGLAMGLYISGNAIGGMSGRVLISLVAEAASWRVALGTLGAVSLLCALWFWLNLPPSRNFRPRPPAPLALAVAHLAGHLRDPALRHLYAVGFLVMGAFVALFNYVGYHLVAPPYSLSQATVGWIFLVYLVGTVSSPWMGRLADRLGRRQVLRSSVAIMAVGAALTLTPSVAGIALGIAVFTFGFFGAHSIASGWVARRVQVHRAQASALYLLFYYVGASVGGSGGGLFWDALGWPAVVGMELAALGAALLLTRRLAAIPPLGSPARSG